MKYVIIYVLLFISYTIKQIYAEDTIESLLNKFPVIATNDSFLKTKSSIKNILWSRSEMQAIFSANQLTYNDKQLFISNKPVEFLSLEKSNEDYSENLGLKDKSPLVIYRWEFNIEKDGQYLITSSTDLGAIGYLNDQRIVIISNGIVSRYKSGQLWLPLLKGRNILFIAASTKNSNQINIISEIDFNLIKNELIKRLSSNAIEDVDWVLTSFIPNLLTLNNGYFPHVISELERINKIRPFAKNDDSVALLKSFVLQNNHDSYMIEKHLYTKYPEIYFHLPKSVDAKNNNPKSFLFSNNELRTIFLQQLIYDGQKKIAEKYFNQCLEIIQENKDVLDKEKLIAELYSQRFVSYFRIGRIKDANEILKQTQEICKKFPLPRYIDGRPDQEDVVTLTNSFDESIASQIKELINNYDGSQDQLAAIHKTYFSLSNHLIKGEGGAIGLRSYFQMCLANNQKLKKEFEKFCLEKIEAKINKAKESRDIKLIEEIIEQYEDILSFPELHLVLMAEYFNRGAFSKSLSQAYYIYDKHADLHSKIISMLVILENLSEIEFDQRKKLSPELLNSEVKILGQMTTIEKLINQRKTLPKEIRGIGNLLKTIPLEKAHSQYRNHQLIPNYQPIEPIFTKNNIVFNGASYLMNYSVLKNEIEWSYFSKFEYKKDLENGPHQKRFITEHSGNQLFLFTNRDNSEKKSVKCFDLKGNLLWDMSDQSISLIEEPLCTPIEAQGKLFGLSYSNRESINLISFCVYDSSSGNLISKTPISNIPGSPRDANCHGVNMSWNTFTHDKHFEIEGSSVFGFSGTGIIFKADAISGNLIWEKGVPKTNLAVENSYLNYYGYAPSGFIRIFGDTLLCYMPDSQIFTALNKITGDQIWKSSFYRPQYIHDRGKTDSLFFSTINIKNESILYKINPTNGEIIWHNSSNGLVINGEGDILDDKLYLPSENSILEYDIQSGKLMNTLNLNMHPLKIRCNLNHTVVLSANASYIFQNNGKFDASLANEIKPIYNVAPLVEPDNPSTTLSFENLNLESTIKIPETIYTNSNPRKKSQLIKTTKPFHFLLKCQDNLTLFREGYYQKNGLHIPPEIIWFGQFPCYDIYEDILIVSENGNIFASNIFNREIIWTYQYEKFSSAVKNNWHKAPPVIAVSKQHIAFQTENQTIRVLDRNSRAFVIEFNAPAISMIRMEGNYIVTSNEDGPVRCYDISQNGKEIWALGYDHYREIFIEKGLLVFAKANVGAICFYDLKTGVLKVQASGGGGFVGNRWRLDDNILYAYKKLYDAKTGQPMKKYQAGTSVEGGGYIGFFKALGQEGNYIDNGKEYYFKTKGGYNESNYLFSAIRKGNRLTIFSFFHVETFEIINDKLISIDFSSINTGQYGSRADQVGMELYPLDNSLLVIRKEDMYFFRNFDSDLKYETIKSFRVENRKKFPWPYSELYPEVEVDNNNWISYYGHHSKRKIAYQAFGDESFGYLKIKLSPKANQEISHTLYLSADGNIGKISIVWDVDHWNNAQCSFNVNANTESWKEIDIQGNISLYIKMRISGAFPSQFKNTLPNFNIELRQMSGKINEGLYRIGGAYNGVIDILPWLNYSNDEGQSLKDFYLRTSLYENKINFYPQGSDLLVWLKDRRRFKGIANNLQLLNQMLEINAQNYCVVNILSVLLTEEVQALKLKELNLDEFSPEFSQKVSEIIARLEAFALAKGVNKEWVDFALSFWTIEVFPNKYNQSRSGGRAPFTKPYYGISLKSGKNIIASYSFLEKNNLLTPCINQPYLEWVFPGLMPNYPQAQDINVITFDNFICQKTGLGRMIAYSPKGAKEFCSRQGLMSEPAFKLMGNDVELLTIKESKYVFKGKKLDCFALDTTSATLSLSLIVPNIKTPSALKSTGQSADSILYALENLPSDNNNGLLMIDNYLSLSGKKDEKELVQIYSKWLNGLRYNSKSCYHALNSIWKKNQEQKNVIDFIYQIIKETKLPTLAPRRFYLDRRNIFLNKEARSILGPVFNELAPKPELKFQSEGEYKTIDSAYKFGENLESKKGGSIYIASKVTIDTNEKAFLFVRAVNDYSTSYTSSTFSVWVNGKSIVENEFFNQFDEDTFFQKITFNSGENIILVKINGIENYKWDNNYSICLGDIYGAPIKGIEMKAVHTK